MEKVKLEEPKKEIKTPAVVKQDPKKQEEAKQEDVKQDGVKLEDAKQEVAKSAVPELHVVYTLDEIALPGKQSKRIPAKKKHF